MIIKMMSRLPGGVNTAYENDDDDDHFYEDDGDDDDDGVEFFQLS